MFLCKSKYDSIISVDVNYFSLNCFICVAKKANYVIILILFFDYSFHSASFVK